MRSAGKPSPRRTPSRVSENREAATMGKFTTRAAGMRRARLLTLLPALALLLGALSLLPAAPAQAQPCW